MFLTDTEAVFNLAKYQREESSSTISSATSSENSVIRMQLVGGQLNPTVIGTDPLTGKTNYFVGNNSENWKTNVSTYQKVHYDSVYPGIDLSYYGNQGQLEYDFIVKPGANPDNIELSFAGADTLELAANGSLLIHLNGEVISLQKPVLYQMINGVRHDVSGAFSLQPDQLVKFHIGGYNPLYELVIDPVLVYSSYLGGSGEDDGNDIAVDNNGNTYIVGSTVSPDFPTQNPYHGTIDGNQNIFVTKLSNDGSTLIYSTFIGGDGSNGKSIAVNENGEAYITGYTQGFNFPIQNAYQSVYGGGTNDGDAFLLKLSTSGDTLLFSTFFGGSGDDSGNSISLDASGNPFITGYTASTNMPSQNGYQKSYAGNWDAFVAKFSNLGNTLNYFTYLGGDDPDIGLGIATDEAGNAYVTGQTWSTNFPVLNGYQNVFGGWTDSFVTRISSDGSSIVYSTYLGGEQDEFGSDISVHNGEAYITGTTYSANFPTVNGYDNVLGGGGDGFITKLNASGNSLVYSTFIGGGEGSGIAVDNSGNAYVAGSTSSDNFPIKNPYQSNRGGGIDAFILKLSNNGNNLIYSTYFGGTNLEQAKSIAIDGSGAAYITGITLNTLPVMNAFDSSWNQSFDAFVAKFVELSNHPPTVVAGGPYHVNEGGSIQLSATGSDPENGSLTYAWDLDNNGSFETSGQTVTFSANTLDGPSSKTITVQVTDNGNLTATDQATVNIDNVAPTVSTITAPSAPAQVNTSINASALFTDPGIQDTHTATWNWGDGNITTGTVTESSGSGSVSNSHTYTATGIYTVTLTVTDKDGASASQTFEYVSVYNPTPQGLFTGARKFDSPAGAYLLNSSLTGQIQFGVVAKYSCSVPTANVSMNFKDAHLNFVATSVTSLVIASGKATLQGSGTVNGSSGYEYAVIGLDGSPDAIRFQIKDPSSNVIYDTQPGEAITATPTTSITGQVIIH